ncbi:galactose-3-O-sulfotransferase 2-like [Argopecten irradians]|uniref:galactose-3-O-sulfotransferase 2-like n=1 Tax=Argopecten irradians TaxID=31199 RepID=UPI00371ABD1C
MMYGCCIILTLLTVGRYVNSTEKERKEMQNRALLGIKVFSDETQYKQIGNPVHHIAFIKVPKSASTTVQNIFLRYGDEHNLTFALPSVNLAGGPRLTSKYFYPPANNNTYDISCTHIIYNTTDFNRAMPHDTRYIVVVREPFSRFQSAVKFSRYKDVISIEGDDPVLEFLRKEEIQMKKPKGLRNKGICNPMSMFLGFPDQLFGKTVDREIKAYLLQLEKEIDIVLILEQLDESIVLMRRMLNWDLRHVLYSKLRVNKQTDPRLKFGEAERKLYKDCGHPDYQVYAFFAQKLKEMIRKQPPDFYDELAYFRKTRQKFDSFCSTVLSDDFYKEMTFEGSMWNKPFVVKKEHCEKLHAHDVNYLEMLKRKQGYKQ